MVPENTQMNIATWNALAGKLSVIGFLPYMLAAIQTPKTIN